VADHLTDDLRERIPREGQVFWVADRQLGVFEPAAADRLDSENFQGAMLPDTLADLFLPARLRRSVAWAEVRTALFEGARALNRPEPLRRLHDRMRLLANRASGAEIDLTRFAQRIATQSLIPLVVDGLAPAEHKVVEREVMARADRLFATGAAKPTLQGRVAHIATEISAGRAIRRALLERRRGRRPAGEDMAQALLPLYDRLGGGRAAYAVTTVLSAIAGAPGPAFACLLFELTTRPEWRRRIEAELCRLSVDEICAAPVRSAPETHDFVREVLRLWSFPLIVRRVARRPLALAGARLQVADGYFLSAFITHRMAAAWPNPDEFDPGRWSAGDASTCGFAPFGWGQRTCVGASIGVSHLILFCHLLATEFHVKLGEGLRPQIRLSDIAAPHDFRGEVGPRRLPERGEQVAAPREP
jgi:cytochrome P450